MALEPNEYASLDLEDFQSALIGDDFPPFKFLLNPIRELISLWGQLVCKPFLTRILVSIQGSFEEVESLYIKSLYQKLKVTSTFETSYFLIIYQKMKCQLTSISCVQVWDDSFAAFNDATNNAIN
ncbi:MAG TPA: hypothetical protein VE089_05555 [Nitrososphaeraceae archaeon]|jgi:hypothetical protein|nr:hypothetical protein [Nitrososphaeraceae archaeon]